MKKQTLLGAIALTTIAAGAAGAASAQQYTVVLDNVASKDANAIGAPVSVASEVKLTGTTAKGVVSLSVVPSASAILPGGNSLLTFTLTGGHTFGTNVTPGAILTGANCKPTTTISEGGLAASSSVTFLISGLGACNNGNPIEADLPVSLGNTKTALGVDTAFTTEFKTPIDGGKASLADIIDFTPAFSVKVVADKAATKADLPDFTTFVGDDVLGTVAVIADTTVVKGIDDVTKTVAQSDITKADYKFVGAQSTKAASLELAGVAVDPATGTVSVATPSNAARTVTAVANGEAIPASAYSVAVTLTLKSDYAAQPAYGPEALDSITRAGTTYLIPWVASGTLSQANGQASVVRIANKGTDDTGAVSFELLTSSTGVPASTALVALTSKIEAGKDFSVTGQSVQDALGANFGRGDIRITVEADPSNLITRRFLQNVTNGTVSEVSLGRDVNGNEPEN